MRRSRSSQKCHGQLPSLRLRTTEHCDQRQGFMALRSLTAQACLCIWEQLDAAGHSRLSGHLFLHENAHTTNSYMPMSLAETTQISALCAEERASQGDAVTCKIDTPLLPYVSKVVEASLKTKPPRAWHAQYHLHIVESTDTRLLGPNSRSPFLGYLFFTLSLDLVTPGSTPQSPSALGRTRPSTIAPLNTKNLMSCPKATRAFCSWRCRRWLTWRLKGRGMSMLPGDVSQG
jgi:hypothetical protein